MFTGCIKCCIDTFTFNKPAATPVTLPLHGVNNNLRLRRKINLKECRQDSEESIQYVVKKQLGSVVGLSDQSSIPDVCPIRVQPQEVSIYRPDVEENYDEDSHHKFLYSDSMNYDDSEDIDNDDRHESDDSGSRGDSVSLWSNNTSLHDVSIAGSICSGDFYTDGSCPDDSLDSGSLTRGVSMKTMRRRRMKKRRPFTGSSAFISPDDAAMPPDFDELSQQEQESDFNVSAQSSSGRPTDLQVIEHEIIYQPDSLSGKISNIFMKKRTNKYEVQLREGGPRIPLKSAITVNAISNYKAHSTSENNPIWYSFGILSLSVHQRKPGKLDIQLVQLTELPPYHQVKTSVVDSYATASPPPALDVVDIKIKAYPSRNVKIIKNFKTGTRDIHNKDNLHPKISIKIGNLCEDTRLVISVWRKGRRKTSVSELCLGVGVVPVENTLRIENVIPVQLRYGYKDQRLSGCGLIFLSAAPSSHGTVLVGVEIKQLKYLNLQLLGVNQANDTVKGDVVVIVKLVTNSSKTNVQVQLKPVPLLSPSSNNRSQGWEARFKYDCSASLLVPEDMIISATCCVVVQIYGRLKQHLKTKKALLGQIQLGPEQTYGGNQPMQAIAAAAQSGTIPVPGDPFDQYLTHWGQVMDRRSKMPMWHRIHL